MEDCLSAKGWDDKEKALLTEKQRECLEEYMKLGSVRSVAKKLGKDRNTVRANVRAACEKLNVTFSDLPRNQQSSVAQVDLNVVVDSRSRKCRDGRTATAQELYSLIKKQEFKCALSGVDLSPENAAVDHVVPVSKGGSDEVRNLQWVHKDVNKAKGSMLNEDFIAMCHRVTTWRR